MGFAGYGFKGGQILFGADEPPPYRPRGDGQIPLRCRPIRQCGRAAAHTRCARNRAAAMLCVIKRHRERKRFLQPLEQLQDFSLHAGIQELVGSSAIKSCGRLASAMAIMMRCCWPARKFIRFCRPSVWAQADRPFRGVRACAHAGSSSDAETALKGFKDLCSYAKIRIEAGHRILKIMLIESIPASGAPGIVFNGRGSPNQSMRLSEVVRQLHCGYSPQNALG